MPFSQDWKEDPARVQAMEARRVDGSGRVDQLPKKRVVGPPTVPRTPIQKIGDLLTTLTFTELLAVEQQLFSTGYPNVGTEGVAERLTSLVQFGNRLSA